jgi:hypothetical protein
VRPTTVFSSATRFSGHTTTRRDRRSRSGKTPLYGLKCLVAGFDTGFRKKFPVRGRRIALERAHPARKVVFEKRFPTSDVRKRVLAFVGELRPSGFDPLSAFHH